jgi:glutaminyl-tRNA synthetase
MIEAGIVDGWDDPRMPTLCGLRRRGYTPASIHNFSARNGVAKVNSVVDFAFLEYCLREDLNEHAQRAMAVLKPVKLIIDNYPEGASEEFDVENNPKDENAGMRKVTFSRELWIESEDFMEVPAPKYFRLFPGNEVRLKGAYVVKCTGFKKDEEGNLIEVLCEYDPDSRGGDPADGRKIKSTIHWLDAHTAANAEVRLYSNLFTDPDPDGADKDFLECLNPESLEILSDCKVEATIAPDGYFASYALEYKIDLTVLDMKTSAQVKTDIVYTNPGESVTVTPLEGYESFPEMDDSLLG